jgi:hypothetical protein
MLNLKSNFVLAGMISATTLLTGIGFSSSASANDSYSSSHWGHSCPAYHHYDQYARKCVKDSHGSGGHGSGGSGSGGHGSGGSGSGGHGSGGHGSGGHGSGGHGSGGHGSGGSGSGGHGSSSSSNWGNDSYKK